MLDKTNVPRASPENPEVEHYKALVRLTEQRARDIRRIAAFERGRLEERLLQQQPTIKAYAGELERLRSDHDRLTKTSEQLRNNLTSTKAQLQALEQDQARIAASRAHRLAKAYVNIATGNSRPARILRLVRPIARVLKRMRRWLMSR